MVTWKVGKSGLGRIFDLFAPHHHAFGLVAAFQDQLEGGLWKRLANFPNFAHGGDVIAKWAELQYHCSAQKVILSWNGGRMKGALAALCFPLVINCPIGKINVPRFLYKFPPNTHNAAKRLYLDWERRRRPTTYDI